MPLRQTLRAGTSDDHRVVDAAFARFDLGKAADYAAFLSAHARVLAAAETALEQAGIERIIPDWPERRRREKLADDLAVLGVARPAPLPCPAFSSDDEILGAAYVLEGSKLGGAMLAKQVPEHLPSAYLSWQGPKGAMKTFMDRLDAAEPEDEARALAAAKSVFALFRQAAELELEPIAS